MRKEAYLLKHLLSQPKLSKQLLKELLLRLVYVEMLDHDGQFGQIYAVKATHEQDLAVKRQAYLCCAHILDDKNELVMLLINTMQQDLQNADYLVVCAALNAIAKLVTDENNAIPALLPMVEKLLEHQSSHVRKKAVLCLQKFAKFAPESTEHLGNAFRRMLCDADPSVMFASLCVLRDLCEREPAKYVNLVPSFVSILKQIVERRLPTSYDYHKVPAPFAQIKILKILAILGAGDKEASKQAYEVIQLALKKAEKTKSSTGDGILLECVFTIAKIYPNRELLELCEVIVRRFINRGGGGGDSTNTSGSKIVSSAEQWRNANLKYAALDALAKLAPRLPDCAAEHQMHIVDSLDSEDESVRAKTFDLLSKITTANNCDVIVEKMLGFLKKSNDRHVRADFALKTSQTIEKYAPDSKWFLENTNKVLELLQGDGHEPTVPEFESSMLIAESVKNTLRDGISGDDTTDDEMRQDASKLYMSIVQTKRDDCKPLPRAIVDIACFAIGRFAKSSSIENLTNTLAVPFESDVRNASLVLDAYWHLRLRHKNVTFSERAMKVIEWCASSSDIEKHRVASDLLQIMKDPELGTLFNTAANVKGNEFDFSAIDAYTKQALANGAKVYSKPKSIVAVVVEKESFDASAAASSVPAPVYTRSEIQTPYKAKAATSVEQNQQQHQDLPKIPLAPVHTQQISESEQRKQQLARDLFGGGARSSEKSVNAVETVQVPTTSSPSTTTTIAESASFLGDLLSGFPSTASSYAPPPSSAVVSDANTDLLGDFLSLTSIGNGPSSSDEQKSHNKGTEPMSPTSPSKSSSSIGGGKARESAKKDPFADLFS